MSSRLSLGVSTFVKIRENNLLYVDKTQDAYNLITNGFRYFISRPRRFGKSLFVSTLQEILKSNKQLFKGLWIEKSDYHWHHHGVISLDLSNLGINSAQTFNKSLCIALARYVQEYDLGITLDTQNPSLALHILVKELYKKFGHVAVLIDEYDSPILQTINETKRAKEIRDAIRLFFAAIKGLDKETDFVFITGVSSFAKAGLFSGMNNLQTITFDNHYATLFGYTDEEIDHYFSDYISQWAAHEDIATASLREQLKEWYDGYRFSKNAPRVYNPFSVMNALKAQEFKNFWMQSGTPTFLAELLKKEYESFDPERLEATEDELGIFDVGNIPLVTLMVQAGYLTILNYDRDDRVYKLTFPNYEVKTSFQKYILEAFAHIDARAAEQIPSRIRSALNKVNIEEFVTLLKQLLSKVPYHLHVKKEKYYHSIFIAALEATGIKTSSEYSISHGRIDAIIELPKILYIVEIKFNASAQKALDQIESQKYFQPFLGQKKTIALLGLSFDRKPKKFDITAASKII